MRKKCSTIVLIRVEQINKSISMKILDFIEKTKLKDRNECEKAELLCYYKETGNEVFPTAIIGDLFAQCGFSLPNISRLKKNLTTGRNRGFIIRGGNIESAAVKLQELEKCCGKFWKDKTTIISSSELIDEEKFCGKRGYLDRIIHQINHTYSANCYDATAVLMRRLFEVILILSYQNIGIDDQIKNQTGDGYIMLESIVKDAKNNQALKLSRIKCEFDTFRMVGNFSAHNITYTAGKKDIDDIKVNYRVMLEELYNKAGLL